jgi:hypothetical protein
LLSVLFWGAPRKVDSTEVAGLKWAGRSLQMRLSFSTINNKTSNRVKGNQGEQNEIYARQT